MAALGKILRWFFGLAGVFVFSLGINFVVTGPRQLRHSFRQNNLDALPVSGAALWITVVIMSLAVALVAGVFFAAWWTVGKGKRSARIWAILASLLLIPTGLFLHDAYIGTAAGLLGLIAFSRRSTIDTLAAARPAKAPRIAGDGTSQALDWLGTAAIYGGLFIGADVWSAWALRQDLPDHGSFPERLLLVILAGFIATGVHELGHALTALAMDMKVRRLTVGAFDWRMRQGKWQCRFSSNGLLSAGGAMGAVPVTMEDYRWRQIAVCAAGPLASFCLGVFAFWAAVNAVGTPWESGWKLLSYVSTYSFLGFVVNLIPMRPQSLYSDGAKIYQLLADGPAAHVEHAFAMLSSQLVSPLRPRDMDVRLIKEATQYCTGERALLLKLNTLQCLLDAGRIPEALEALADAEAAYAESREKISGHLRPVVHDAFTFMHAFVRRDASTARSWWNRTAEKRPEGFTADAWRAYSALLWIENRAAEARDAWVRGNAVAQQSPAAGAYDFDRDTFAQLRNELEAVAA